MSDKTITKKGIQVRAGQVWRDLDKRMRDRLVTITRVDDLNGLAHYQAKTAKSRLRINRMHEPYWELILKGLDDPAAT